MRPPSIVETDGDPALVGGKAAQLARLAGGGLPVPPWFVVTTSVFDEVAGRIGVALDEALADLETLDPDRVAERAVAIQSLFRAAGLAEADAASVRAAFDRTIGQGTAAVRSSAVGEDGADDSFAGQLESYLHVGRRDVVDRVVDCLASAFGARALFYRRLRAGGPGRVRAAVVVQRLVEGAASGVLFTANPTTGATDEMVVAAGLGMGEGVVGDRVETDTWILEAATGDVRQAIVATKASRIDLDPAGGTRLVAVEGPAADRPVLAPEALLALAELGRRVEALFARPQDVEWVVDPGGAIHLVQSRPITAGLGGRERIFDNSNLVEGYPGVTTPLTYSFARLGYEVIFRNGARAFGVPERVLARERSLFAHMVALIDGRLYYDLLNWYRLYSLIPGFEGRIDAWEKALGLRHRASVPAAGRAGLGARLRVGYRMVRNLIALDADVRRFAVRFERVQARFRASDLDRLDADGLLDLFDHLVDELLFHWEVTIVNDFYCFNGYELLGRLVDRWGLGGDLLGDLLGGLEGVESVEPVRSVLDLVDRVAAEPALARLLDEVGDDDRVARRIAVDPDLADFRRRLALHLERYGDRTVHELQLETPPADEVSVVGLVRAYRAAGRRAADIGPRERARRIAAEERLEAGLRHHPVREAVLRLVLGRTRAAVRHRESMRLARTRAFGMVKRIFGRLGGILAEAGSLEDAGDVFYLTVEEVAGFVRGGSVCRSLAELVALRRREFDAYRRRRPAGRLRSRGLAYLDLVEDATPPAADRDADDGRLLIGQGCSPGRVRGRARVVLDPRRRTADDRILVAPMTDPGWVFLMVAARGLVVERGSVLSHSAIIGRELGIPTVVGVAGATARIEDGAEIEIDGERGTVRLL